MKAAPFMSTKGFFTQMQIAYLNLGANLMSEIPYNQLQEVNETMKELDLSSNVFIELGLSRYVKGGSETFPYMKNLETLNLDSCRTQQIHQDAFIHLPNLKVLSLKQNPLFTVPPGTMLPSLNTLIFECMEGDDYNEGDVFCIPEKIFDLTTDMSALKILSFTNCPLEPLNSDMFIGLNHLDKLFIEDCSLQGIHTDAFSHLTSVSTLSLASSTGISALPSSSMRGPTQLEVVDLSNIQMSPTDLDHMLNNDNVYREGESYTMRSTKVLNLTGSLINMEDPFDYMSLELMPKLEILDLSKNRLTGWSEPEFIDNFNLRTFIMTQNHDFISISSAMIQDFCNLTRLDLSNNEFFCNEGITRFMVMVNTSADMDVVGYHMGYGYSCRSTNGTKLSFKEYADGIELVDVTTSPTEQIEYLMIEYGKIVGSILAGAVFLAFLILLGNHAYNNRWYIQYKLAKRKIMKAKLSKPDSNLTYEAFVSYNREDGDFVQEILAPNLEQVDPKVKLCLHERDFQVGRSIFENIIDSLETSKACIIVLSESYAKSEWCRFEAQMALRLFEEDDKNHKMILVIVRNELRGILLDKSLKSIIKLRTYLQWRDSSQGRLTSQDTHATFFKRLRFALNIQ